MCALCNTSRESLDYLFIQCAFVRAVWLGVNIDIASINAHHISLEQWIQHLAQQSRDAANTTNALELVLTALWCIWTHRNRTIFEGTPPNPIDTVLIIKSFLTSSHSWMTNCPELTHPIRQHTTINGTQMIAGRYLSKLKERVQSIANGRASLILGRPLLVTQC